MTEHTQTFERPFPLINDDRATEKTTRDFEGILNGDLQAIADGFSDMATFTFFNVPAMHRLDETEDLCRAGVDLVERAVLTEALLDRIRDVAQLIHEAGDETSAGYGLGIIELIDDHRAPAS